MIYQKKKKSKNPITLWRLFMVLILMSIVSATLLRINNVRMIQRRDSVLAADKLGDDDMLEERLYDLKKFSFSHMNASTGPFFLEQSYRRETERIISEAKQDANSNDQRYYRQAQETCEARFAGKRWSSHYVNCYLTELDKNQQIEQKTSGQVKLPSVTLYRRNYVSPLLSFDFAGLSVIIWFILLLVIILKLLYKLVLYLVIRVKQVKNS